MLQNFGTALSREQMKNVMGGDYQLIVDCCGCSPGSPWITLSVNAQSCNGSGVNFVYSGYVSCESICADQNG